MATHPSPEKTEDGNTCLARLQNAVDSHPDDPSLHFNLGLFLWEKNEDSKVLKEKAAEHFVTSVKLNPQNAVAFRYLGHYYSEVSSDTERALKCYQRALHINPDDSHSGEPLCDLLDKSGKGRLQYAVCREASEKSPRAFWAFCRLGYLQMLEKKWSEAVQSLQHAIRGCPTRADLWEALGLSYQRLGMFTAALKSYGRAVGLEETRVFALVESGNILLMLGSHRKGIEHFQEALKICPQSISANYGLASALLGLSKECTNMGAFRWGASLLEEASEVAKENTCLAGNFSCIWKLHGDIQLAYAKCFPWMEEGLRIKIDEDAFNNSICSWKKTCCEAAVSASCSYQRAVHLAPWQANLYVDIAIASDLICTVKESYKSDLADWKLPEKMSLGGLLIEGDNSDFWVALGCLSHNPVLKQHAFIRALQLDASLAVAWAYLGKIYRKEGVKRLADQAFDSARSIDPNLGLPWAGMSADDYTRMSTSTAREAYECCFKAVQILPLAEFQIGLANLALLSDHLLSPQVFGAVRQAVQRAPHYPESHNLNGLVCESRFDYQSAIASYRLARCAISSSSSSVSKSHISDISINLARSLSKAGDALDAVHECENLYNEGLLDAQGLQIYAFSLWQLGRNDVAVSVVRTLASGLSSLEPTSRVTSVCFICRLLYCISGQESVINNILKMPRELLMSSKVSFVVSSIHALDQGNRLEPVISGGHSYLVSQEEITEMHFLTALSKLIKHRSEHYLNYQSGVRYLRKALHIYPNSRLLRNLLGYLLLFRKEWNDAHNASRCCIIDCSDGYDTGIKSACEILGAGTVACCVAGINPKFSFPTCGSQCLDQPQAIRELQKWLHQEPWNSKARYFLILNFVQKACEQRFPQHLLVVLRRLIIEALSSKLYSDSNASCQYQQFQLLLCASEISLQDRNFSSCIAFGNTATTLSVPNSSLFFAHLLLCRAYAAQADLVNLRDEYIRCLQRKTDNCIGWLCLLLIEEEYKLQTDSNDIELSFQKCLNVVRSSEKMWVAVFYSVRGLICLRNRDLLSAEELCAQACSLAAVEPLFLLFHGIVCMELAREQCGEEFLLVGVKSLRKCQQSSAVPLPATSMLLAQAEGSLGSKQKWEWQLHSEWSSWRAGMKPTEVYFQMHLLAKELQGRRQWVLRAIHLNPACLRYWRVLYQLIN